MKVMTGLFGFGVLGVVVCFVMTVVTAVQEHQLKQLPPTHVIPAPALNQ